MLFHCLSCPYNIFSTYSTLLNHSHSLNYTKCNCNHQLSFSIINISLVPFSCTCYLTNHIFIWTILPISSQLSFNFLYPKLSATTTHDAPTMLYTLLATYSWHPLIHVLQNQPCFDTKLSQPILDHPTKPPKTRCDDSGPWACNGTYCQILLELET